MNSTASYIETLQTIGPIFKRLRDERDIEVFWVGLPPHGLNLSVVNASTFGYEWIYYEHKDSIAKQILRPYGVTFVDVNALVKARKLVDENVAADGIHWW